MTRIEGETAESSQAQEITETFRDLLFEIAPETLEYYALRDLLEREYRRLAFDRGGRPDAKYDLCSQRIQRRMDVPRYADAFERLNKIHQEWYELDPKAVIKMIEIGKEIGVLSEPSKQNPQK